VRGPWIAGSYYDAPDQKARWSEDGWFRTGDIATIDDEGYLKLVDRSKGLGRCGKEKIPSKKKSEPHRPPTTSVS